MKPRCSCRYWGAVQGFVDLTRQKTPQLPNVARGNANKQRFRYAKIVRESELSAFTHMARSRKGPDRLHKNEITINSQRKSIGDIGDLVCVGQSFAP